jgi:hypothetical protein
MFFSEEKNQKTFMSCAGRTIRDLAGNLAAQDRVSINVPVIMP